MYFGFSLWWMNFVASVLACFSNHGTGGQVCCTLRWSIPFWSHWLGLCIPIFSCSYAVDVIFHWFQCDWFFFWVYMIKVLCAYVCVYSTVKPTWKCFGAFLKVVTWLTLLVLDMVLQLYVLVLSTSMSLFVISSIFGITRDFSSGVLIFIFLIFIFSIFLFLGVTAEFLLGCKF